MSQSTPGQQVGVVGLGAIAPLPAGEDAGEEWNQTAETMA